MKTDNITDFHEQDMSCIREHRRNHRINFKESMVCRLFNFQVVILKNVLKNILC